MSGAATGRGPTVLHFAPHPDDELIGAPATLMALRDAGWTVVNLACSLGSSEHRPRRVRELEAASSAAGFVLEILDAPIGDPLSASEVGQTTAALSGAMVTALARHRPALVVAPSPHDRHRGHEVVGRAALEVLASTPWPPPPLWLWGLWADLPFPTLALSFDEQRLDEVLDALAAHEGELERNDYRRLVRGRAEMNASLGPERVFGFGSASPSLAYVELVSELVRVGERWHLGHPRWLDPANPFGGSAGDEAVAAGGTAAEGVAVGARGLGPDVSDWLTAPSLTTRYGPPGNDAPGARPTGAGSAS